MSRGCLIGRSLKYAIGVPVTTTAALKALAVDDPRRADGCITVVLADSSIWVCDIDSSAVAGPTILVPDSGSGRFVAAGGGGLGAGFPKLMAVRGASTANIANLAAFTVAGVDGLTYIEDERILIKDQTTKAQRGPYRVGAVAGGLAPLTRVGEADASAEVVAGMLVYVSAGTAGGNKWFYLTTDDPIVLGTTELDFAEVPTAVGFTSLETRLSTAEVARSSGDSSVTLITSSLETRLSTAASTDVSGDSSVTLITSSIETRLSGAEVARSSGDSSVTLITSSVETRLSVEESTRATTALTLLATATITSDDLTAVGVGPEIENVGAVMHDNAVPMLVRAKLTDAFDNGAGVSLTMTVGWNGAADRYVTAFNCFTGSPVEGTGWESGTRNAEPQFGFPTGSTQIVAGFTAGGDTLANFTAGSVTIELWGLLHS